MIEQEMIREGMTVRTAEGRRVGLVTGVGESHFELEPGLLPVPRRDYLIEYSDVASVRGHDVFLREDARFQLEEDDDGGALPPRHGNLEAEPVNIEEPVQGP